MDPSSPVSTAPPFSNGHINDAGRPASVSIILPAKSAAALAQLAAEPVADLLAESPAREPSPPRASSPVTHAPVSFAPSSPTSRRTPALPISPNLLQQRPDEEDGGAPEDLVLQADKALTEELIPVAGKAVAEELVPQADEPPSTHNDSAATIVAAADAPSSPPYTTNTFALAVPSPSPPPPPPPLIQLPLPQSPVPQTLDLPEKVVVRRPGRKPKQVPSTPQSAAATDGGSIVVNTKGSSPVAGTTTRFGRKVTRRKEFESEPVSKASPPPTKNKPNPKPKEKLKPKPKLKEEEKEKEKEKEKGKEKEKEKTKEKPAAKKGANGPQSPVATAVLRRRKAEAARWKTDFVLCDQRSPLTNFDLRALLLQPEAWAALDAKDKREVLSLFPSGLNILGTGTEAAPDISSLRNDDNFRHDCARYRSDLADGFFDHVWLEEAFEAHEMRREGMFDQYVLDEFEESWGVGLPGRAADTSVGNGDAENGDAGNKKEIAKQPEEAMNIVVGQPGLVEPPRKRRGWPPGKKRKPAGGKDSAAEKGNGEEDDKKQAIGVDGSGNIAEAEEPNLADDSMKDNVQGIIDENVTAKPMVEEKKETETIKATTEALSTSTTATKTTAVPTKRKATANVPLRGRKSRRQSQKQSSQAGDHDAQDSTLDDTPNDMPEDMRDGIPDGIPDGIVGNTNAVAENSITVGKDTTTTG